MIYAVLYRQRKDTCYAMNNTHPVPAPTIQRTLIITAQGVSAAVGRLLSRRWQTPTAPQPALAVVSPPADDLTPDLAAALRHISPLNLRQLLAERGWTLHRPEEIIVYILQDITVSSPTLLAQWRQQASAITQAQLGVEPIIIVVALFPQSETDAPLSLPPDWLAAAALSTAQLRQASHDVCLLSMVNEARFCLPDVAEFTAIVADILDAIITTPLQVAPEWAVSPSLNAIGLAAWSWDAAAAQSCLAAWWIKDILHSWQRALTTEEAGEAGILAHNWWLAQGLLPAQLAAALKLPPTPPLSPWRYPQPWRIPDLLAALQAAAQAAAAPLPDLSVSLPAQLSPSDSSLMLALQRDLAHLLDTRPPAAISRALTWLDTLESYCQEAQDWLNQRQLVQRQRLDALQQQTAPLQQRLTQMGVKIFPPQKKQPHWLVWGKILFMPWRWPLFVWRYWQMQTAAAHWQQIIQEQQRWQQQTFVCQLLAAFYADISSAICHLRQQTEEIGDMLAFVQQQTTPHASLAAPAAAAPHPYADYLRQRYAALLEDLDQEAHLASQAVGGLAQHLTRLDDAVLLHDLIAAASERLQAVAADTAVETIRRLHHTPEALSSWWQQQWEAAAPLWPLAETLATEAERAAMKTITYASAAGIFHLADDLGLTSDPACRWLTAAQPDRILILRWRAGIPPSAAANP